MKARTPVGMKSTRVPWTAKLRPDMNPSVVTDPRNPGRLLLPTPMLVAEEISKVPKGSLLTVSELRDRLALRFQADRTCPMMTGIFFNIVAGAAEEDLSAGRPPIAPYWRLIRDDGTLSPKTPPGPDRQAEHLRLEGHGVQNLRGALTVTPPPRATAVRTVRVETDSRRRQVRA